LRAAVFKGLRDDREAPRVRAPKFVPRTARGKGVHGVPHENILQLLSDAVSPSKEELENYWRRVWKKALPYLGHQGTRLWVDDLDVLGLIEMSVVELHPWNATVEDFEHADQLVIDLDPGEGVEWPRVIEAALAMRDLMVAEGLSSWPKLTGGKGVHLMAPLAERMPHNAAHAYARRLVRELAERDTRHYILSAQASRRGRIFLDYLLMGVAPPRLAPIRRAPAKGVPSPLLSLGPVSKPASGPMPL